MNTSAAIKIGLPAGLLIGITLHWVIFVLLYEKIGLLNLPDWGFSLVNLLIWPVLAGALLFFGPLAVQRAAASGWRQAALAGGAAGLVTGLVSYLINGPTAGVMFFGMLPLIDSLANPATLQGADLEALLSPFIRQAIGGVYLSMLGYVLVWAVLGALEGTVFALARPLWQRLVRRPLTATG